MKSERMNELKTAIRIALYGLDQNDELTGEPWFTMDYKRKTSKKTSKPTG